MKHWEDTALSLGKETWCGIRLWRLENAEYTRDMDKVTCPECLGVKPLWEEAKENGRVNENGIVSIL